MGGRRSGWRSRAEKASTLRTTMGKPGLHRQRRKKTVEYGKKCHTHLLEEQPSLDPHLHWHSNHRCHSQESAIQREWQRIRVHTFRQQIRRFVSSMLCRGTAFNEYKPCQLHVRAEGARDVSGQGVQGAEKNARCGVKDGAEARPMQQPNDFVRETLIEYSR